MSGPALPEHRGDLAREVPAAITSLPGDVGISRDDPAKESNLPSEGLPRPAGLEVPHLPGFWVLYAMFAGAEVPRVRSELPSSGHRSGPLSPGRPISRVPWRWRRRIGAQALDRRLVAAAKRTASPGTASLGDPPVPAPPIPCIQTRSSPRRIQRHRRATPHALLTLALSLMQASTWIAPIGDCGAETTRSASRQCVSAARQPVAIASPRVSFEPATRRVATAAMKAWVTTRAADWCARR